LRVAAAQGNRIAQELQEYRKAWAKSGGSR
jgi:hypothetical protein